MGGSAILGGIKAYKPEDYNRYGYAAGTEVKDGILKIDEVVEKPGSALSKEHMAVVSGYLFAPEMFNAIEESMARMKKANSKEENGYVDALKILLEREKVCYAAEIKNGHYYDCGNKLEYLKAVVEFGLKHDELNVEFSEYLKQLPL
jgi:UTP--glucose-1-phosphate uridylyltransferase